MTRTSNVPPLFVDSARDILKRLSGVTGPAWEMAKEAEELLSIFERWEKEPSTSTERAQTVQRLIDLHRRAQEFLIKNKPV